MRWVRSAYQKRKGYTDIKSEANTFIDEVSNCITLEDKDEDEDDDGRHHHQDHYNHDNREEDEASSKRAWGREQREREGRKRAAGCEELGRRAGDIMLPSNSEPKPQNCALPRDLLLCSALCSGVSARYLFRLE